MILTSKPAIIVDIFWKKNFMARPTELRAAMNFGLEKSSLVQFWASANELMIDPAQERIIRLCEGIFRRLRDDIIGVAADRAAGRADFADRVTRIAGDACRADWIVRGIIIWIVPA